jgi:hypothetical protein
MQIFYAGPHWPDQIGKRERKGSSSRAEIGPHTTYSTRACHTLAQEIDVILMIHKVSLVNVKYVLE